MGDRYFSKTGNLVPARFTFPRGEFAERLGLVLKAMVLPRFSLDIFLSIHGPDGTSQELHRAGVEDMQEIKHPGRDLTYMEVSIDSGSSRILRSTFSFNGSFWFVSLNAESMD